jgi:hypothetical protein
MRRLITDEENTSTSYLIKSEKTIIELDDSLMTPTDNLFGKIKSQVKKTLKMMK